MKNINPKYKRKRSAALSVEDYVHGIRRGDIAVLSRAVTLLESEREEDKSLADKIVQRCLPFSGNSIRIGITGVPGVGKSTFIESMGHTFLADNRKLAVLAVDPSSNKSGGSILGDKTRMESLVKESNVFIRPTPSRGSLGGVAKDTRETIVLLEAAGFDTILIETVGVGQSEIAVRSMVDFFLLLMLAGAGDELQGIKRGIMEMADAVIITKADGENINHAKAAVLEYKNALHLFPPSSSGWIPKVDYVSAIKNEGLEKVLEIIKSYENNCKLNGFFDDQRREQNVYWMQQTLQERMQSFFLSNTKISVRKNELMEDVKAGKINPFSAVDQLMTLVKSVYGV